MVALVGIVIVGLWLILNLGATKLLAWLDGSPIYDESTRCGPHHHWREVRNGYNVERSCEDDNVL
jgi:hypothetical protein